MDLKEYYSDLRKVEGQLEKEFPNDIVYVTSVRHREKNSIAGQTLSATHANAARVITDGTHRLATPEEVRSFLELQINNRTKSVKAEQAKKQQYIVVMDGENSTDAGLMGAEHKQLRGAQAGQAVASKVAEAAVSK